MISKNLRCNDCHRLFNSEIILQAKQCPICGSSVMPRDPSLAVTVNWDDLRFLVERITLSGVEIPDSAIPEYHSILKNLLLLQPEGSLDLLASIPITQESKKLAT